jgi:hypothetical protein
MATYLVDYENVHSNGLNGVNTLTHNDSVIVFMGNHRDELSINSINAMLTSPAQIKIIKMKKTSNNYLDFQLATCLGGLVANGPEKEFYIITNDHFYEPIIDYWKDNKASVSIKSRNTISISSPSNDITGDQPIKSNDIDNKTKTAIRNLLKNEKLKPHQYLNIYTLFKNTNETNDLQIKFTIIYGKQRGSHLYELLKSVFTKYKSTNDLDSKTMGTIPMAPILDPTMVETKTTKVMNPGMIDIKTRKIIRKIVKCENVPTTDYANIYKLFINSKDNQTFQTNIGHLFKNKKGSQLYARLISTFEQYKMKNSFDLSTISATNIKQVSDPARLDTDTKKTIRLIVKYENLQPHDYANIYKLFINSKNNMAFRANIERLFEYNKASHLYLLLLSIFEQYKRINGCDSRAIGATYTASVMNPTIFETETKNIMNSVMIDVET